MDTSWENKYLNQKERKEKKGEKRERRIKMKRVEENLKRYNLI